MRLYKSSWGAEMHLLPRFAVWAVEWLQEVSDVKKEALTQYCCDLESNLNVQRSQESQILAVRCSDPHMILIKKMKKKPIKMVFKENGGDGGSPTSF